MAQGHLAKKDVKKKKINKHLRSTSDISGTELDTSYKIKLWVGKYYNDIQYTAQMNKFWNKWILKQLQKWNIKGDSLIWTIF